MSKVNSFSLVVHRPGDNKKNEDVRQLVEHILDNWRLVTPKQLAIAASVYGYSKPAEMMSPKQEWNLKQAVALLAEAEGEPEGDDGVF